MPVISRSSKGTMFLLVVMMVLLFGPWCTADLAAQIDMAGMSGSVTIDTDTGTLRTNLTGTCGSITVSIHEFPVIHGASQDPCDDGLIGQPLSTNYTLTNGVAELAVDQSVRYDGRPLVVKTCGRQMCVNLLGASQRSWRAVVRSFLIGQVYFLQLRSLWPVTALVDLAMLEEAPVSNATIFFSDVCQVKDLQPLGSVEIGPNQNFARSRVELRVASVMSFLIVQYQGRWACAEVRPIQAKGATAYFSMQGINGSLSFRQESPFHATQITVDLWRLRALAGAYRIHSLPILPRQQSPDNLCDEAHTGQIWDPLAMGSPPSGSNHSSFAIGDLSGRHGSLQGRDRYNTLLTDCHLPLFGNNSVIGRSLVILKSSGEHWACSTIRLEGEVVTAVASFRRGVVGRIMFQQAAADPYSELSIYVELAHISSPTSRNHNWHIHEFPLSSESQSCSSAGDHFNPHRVPTVGNYSQECSPSNPLRCEAGDYAGKHAPLTLLAPAPARYVFTDSSTSLTGPTSISGLPVVIHGPEGVLSRVACANVLLQPPHEGHTGPWSGSGDASGELRASQVSDLDPTWIGVSFHGLRGLAGGFHIHILPVAGASQNPCADTRIQGHFNPFGVNMSSSPAAGSGSDDEYEVGDISGRHFSLLALDNVTDGFLDTNLPLTGPLSVLGRSLVIHYADGSRMQCATFQRRVPSGGDWIGAAATFSGQISGRISLRQSVYPGGGASDTTIMAELQSDTLEQSSALSWSIQSQSRGGGPYNPYEIPDQSRDWCSPQKPRLCRTGDLTGKHGALNPGKRILLTDTNLPLGGDFTVVSRTLALTWGTMELTAPLLPDVPMATLRLQRVTPFNRTLFQEAVSAALAVPRWKVTLLKMEEEEGAGPCQQMEFFIIGFTDSAALSALQSRETLGPFCPLCCQSGSVPPSSGAPLMPPAPPLLILPLTLGLLLPTYPSP